MKYQLKGDYVTGAQLSAFTYDKATIDEKVAEGGTFDPTQYYNKTATDALLDEKLYITAYTPTDLSNYYDKTEVDGLLDDKQDSSKLPTYIVNEWTYNKSTHKVSVAKTNKTTGGASNSTHSVITINNQHIFDNSDVSNLNLVETSAITTSVTSASTDSEIPSAKAVYDVIGQGGGGVTPADVQTMIDESISGKTDESDFSAHTANTAIHVTQSEKDYWDGKSDFSGDYNDLINQPTEVSTFNNDAGYITINDLDEYPTTEDVVYLIGESVSGKQDTLIAGSGISIVNNVISATGGGSITVDTVLDSGSTNPVQNKVLYNKIDEVEQVTAAALNNLNDALNDKQDTLSAGTGISIQGNVISATGGSTPIDAYTKAESDAKFATITNFNSHSGNTNIHVTAAEKNAWNAKADASNVYTKTEVNNLLDEKPNIWCGDETAWSQISGSTEQGTIYLVY